MRAVDRYRIASVSKTFVATVVLQLAAEGRLQLADPVERWLPGSVPNGTAITIRQLLNHTSGLFDYTNDEAAVEAEIANPSRVWTPRDLLSVAFSHPPLFAPGADWSYSNTNYVVLGLVVEAVTGKKLEQVLAERLFEPLDLHATSFPHGLSVPEPFAHGYAFFQGALLDLTPVVDPSWAYAAGDLVSNAADVSSFFAALLRGRLMPAAFLRQMKSFSTTSRTYGLGLQGYFTRCGSAFGHAGDFIGWRNVVLAKADGRRVAVVMVNVDATRLSNSRLLTAAISALCSV
jgi:D-alanyl-D-alanine carboxypeptidase